MGPCTPWSAALAASLLLAALELALLGPPGPSLAAVVVAMHAGLGLAIGGALAAGGALARLVGSRRAGPWLRALGSVPPLALASRNLFEGAYAATLPGARFGPLWLPAAGYAAVVVASALGERLGRAAGPKPVAGALAAGVLLVEIANRRLYVREYADVHALLVATSGVLGALALRAAASAGARPGEAGAGRAPSESRGGPPRPRRGWPRTLLVAGVGAGLALALRYGMADPGERHLVAAKGASARHLARVLRACFDRDGDGASAVLGGGDCDDGKPAVHPGAFDGLGNGVDEDCDGRDGPSPHAAAAPPGAEADAPSSTPALREALARSGDMNVLVVAVDALRADALAPERAADAPRLSAFMAEAVRFERAFATGAGTDLSVASVLTGRVDPFVRLESTLPEALRAAGRATGALYPAEVLRYAGDVLLARGFERVESYVNDEGRRDVGWYTTSARATDGAIALLDALRERGRPFFLWAHYFDVHEHDEIEAGDGELARLGGRYDLGTAAGKYRALLALSDREIGRLFDALRERDLWGRTIVVLLSDHGEGLGEDPRLPKNHGRFVYNALCHVPLSVRVPGAAPRREWEPVSLVDLAPTLLQLGRVEAPPGLDGRSLLPLLAGAGRRGPPPPIALNESEQRGVIAWPYKLLVRPADAAAELYDLAADFGETRDLAGALPGRADELKALLARLPRVNLDRTRRGRRERDERARPPPWPSESP